MRILVAEDETVVRTLLERMLTALGHDVTSTSDGREAWERFQTESYDIVLSDWMMPEVDGPELCRRIRATAGKPFCYVVLLTSKETNADEIAGMQAGADDYIRKPFDREVLHARLQAAERVVTLERRLAAQIEHLQQALDEVKTLRGLLPICMYCHSIRDSAEAWARIEKYLCDHSDVELTHSICPTCYESEVRPMLNDFRLRQGRESA